MQEKMFLTTSAGIKMPRLIYGTAWKAEQTAELVVKAVKHGFRGIDTACQPKHYAEHEVGQALSQLQSLGIKREELFLQTKFTPLAGQDPNRVPYDKNAPLHTQVAQSFEVSQENLQSSYIDSLLLHSPLFPFSELMKVWEAMQNIQKSGQAGQLGISNCYELSTLKRLYEESEIKPAVIQNRFYNDSGYDIELRRWCDEHQVAYQSFWSLTANTHLLFSRTVILLAKKYAMTQEQILFCYLLQIGISPLTGTSSDKHMQEDLDIFRTELSMDEVSSITELLEP